MTNEEAILHMILRREELKNSVGDLDEDIKAFDMAIRALEIIQTGLLKDCESCRAELPCTDAISRQAAIDAFGLSEKTRKYGGDHSGYNTMMLYEIQDVIEDLPPVNTEKKNVEIVKFDTPYTDAISRQAAIDAMREETCLSCWDAKYILEHLPPVSTEKTGRWIKIKPYPLQMHDYECSECGHETDDNTEKHCSECGAKMEVVECEDAISRQREKNISKGFEDFMIKSLQRQVESEE